MKKLTAILLLVSPLFAGAQSYHFKNYNVEDGLPFVQVSTIHQDKRGNLWTGGYGGLSRFDGFRFTNYTTREGLVNHDVRDILEDNNGNLWICTVDGLSMFDGKRFHNYTIEQGLNSNDIREVLIDGNNLLWAATNSGVSMVNLDSVRESGIVYFNHYDQKDGLINNDVNTIFKDSRGVLWFGTAKGVCELVMKGSGRSFFDYTTQQGLPSDNINAFEEDEEGNIWIATSGGLSMMPRSKIDQVAGESAFHSGGMFFNYTVLNGLPSNEVLALELDKYGELWVGTAEGLVSVDDSMFVTYTLGNDYNSNHIQSLFADFEGNMWAGTFAGMFRYSGRSFSTYDSDEGLVNPFVFGITRDRNGHLWSATAGGGVMINNGEKFVPFNVKNGLIHDYVWSTLEDSEGNMWIGTMGGLCKLTPGLSGLTNTVKLEGVGSYVIEWYTERDGLVSDSACVLMLDNNNELWIGGHGGVSKLLPANEQSPGHMFSSYRLSNIGPVASVWCMLNDRKNNYWFGTYQGGFYKYDGKQFRDEAKNLGVESDAYLSIVEDEEGYFYLGTFDGVKMFDPYNPEKNVVSFDLDNGLSDNLVYVMGLGENERNLWVGTNQGLNKIELEEFKEDGRLKIEHYGKEEGFSGVECNSNGVFKDVDGSIWFGTVNGLIKYDPDQYRSNREESITSITGFRLFYQDTVLNSGVRLPWDQNHISFDFVGVCMTNPDKVRYTYLLEGYDDNWAPMTTRNFATYSNLPAGKYTFKVRSRNNEFLWNAEPTTFSFSIQAPFWQLWWFRIGALATLAFSLYVAVSTRIRNIRRSAALSQRMDQLKAEALRSQMNPHFLFNSMNSIQHYINQNEKRLANIYLSKFAELMRKILDNSQKRSVSVAEDLSALELYIELQQLRFENKFSYEIVVDDAIDQNNTNIPPLVLQPYVENAISHGILNLPKEKEGKLKVIMTLREDSLICEIEDNGVGRKAAAEVRHQHASHEPAGLQITSERVQYLGGSENSGRVEIIDLVDHGEPAGTMVRIQLPADLN